MDLEAMSVQPSAKGSSLPKLREYRPDLSNLKSGVNKSTTATSIQTSKEDLLESGLADTLSVSAYQRECLVMSIERLNQSNERIDDGRRTMLESDGSAVILQQWINRQKLSDNPLYGRDGIISKSKKILLLEELEKTLYGRDGIISKSKKILLLEELEKTLHGGDDNIPKSKKILCVMSKRMDKNKWIIISISLVLVLAVLLIIYFKLTS